MSCIKTGAIVYFDNFGFRSPCDVYRIGDCYIFRWNTKGITYEEPSDSDWEVSVITDSDLWFHRKDLGITIVPMSLVCPGDMA